jgi:alcohol dehydrogenase class IV
MALINYITQVQFDYGALALLQQECDRIGIKKPLVVTDMGIRNAGLLDKVLAQLKDGATAVVYDQTPPNPNEGAVRAAVALFREHGCDGIVAVGGGSSIDLAKGVAVCGTHEGPLKSFALIEGGLPTSPPRPRR